MVILERQVAMLTCENGKLRHWSLQMLLALCSIKLMPDGLNTLTSMCRTQSCEFDTRFSTQLERQAQSVFITFHVCLQQCCIMPTMRWSSFLLVKQAYELTCNAKPEQRDCINRPPNLQVVQYSWGDFSWAISDMQSLLSQTLRRPRFLWECAGIANATNLQSAYVRPNVCCNSSRWILNLLDSTRICLIICGLNRIVVRIIKLSQPL